MGYRLEIYKAEYLECGGKLFGYISDEDLHKCKSWLWLKRRGFLHEDDDELWDYGATHEVLLFGDDYKKFIDLYIEDYIKYGYNNPDTIKNLRLTQKCKDLDSFVIAWE